MFIGVLLRLFPAKMRVIVLDDLRMQATRDLNQGRHFFTAKQLIPPNAKIFGKYRKYNNDGGLSLDVTGVLSMYTNKMVPMPGYSNFPRFQNYPVHVSLFNPTDSNEYFYPKYGKTVSFEVFLGNYQFDVRGECQNQLVVHFTDANFALLAPTRADAGYLTVFPGGVEYAVQKFWHMSVDMVYDFPILPKTDNYIFLEESYEWVDFE